MKKTLAASALTAGMLLALGTPALADPGTTPGDAYPATLNGSGSDTTEVVMRALDGASNALGSWDVTGGAWDTNGAGAGCSFTTRFAGSGQGRTALANSLSNGDGCFQFARSSSRNTGVAPGTVGSYTGTGTTVQQFLPITLGIDGLTYVFRAGSATPRNLTLGQLRAIYSCQFTGSIDGLSMSSPTVPNLPLLPANASGSRADWMALMGLTAGADTAEDGGTLQPCVTDGGTPGAGTGEISEHNGNVLTKGRQIVLHSIPQYIAQGRANTGDFRGLSVLGYIGGNVPLQMYDAPGANLTGSSVASTTTTTVDPATLPDGAQFRPVYNLIPAGEVANPDYTAVFGSRSGTTNNAAGTNGANDIPTVDSGFICNATGQAIIVSNGFTPVC